MRQTFSTNTPWEPRVGYARAVRIDQWVLVSGTTATDEQGRLTGPGDAYAQTVQVIRNIERALERAGATLRDVVRTRVYVVDVARDWEDIARGHREFFGEILPACALVQVVLADPAMLVEIEADAVIGSGSQMGPG